MISREWSNSVVAVLVGVTVMHPRNVPARGTSTDRFSARTCPQLPSRGPKPNDLFNGETATDYQVTVTPQAGSTSAYANTSGNTVQFTVQNTGGCSDTYTFSKSMTGVVTGVTLNPTSSTLPAGYSVVVTATYSVGGAWGTGTVTLTAQGVSTNHGTYTVTVPSNGPVVSTVPTNGDYRDISKCVWNCFDAVTSYTTPPYFSGDQPHSVQLVYRSGQAHPLGIVEVDAVDTSSVNPITMSIQLKRSDGTSVTFTNGSTEIFFSWVSHPADGNVNRLAVQFDSGGSGLATGAHNYTVVVRSYRSNGFRENDVPVRVLIVNEANSPFGAGWSIAGFQRLYLQPNGDAVITEGDGSITYFKRTATSCNGQGICGVTYASPKGDFSTLGGDSAYNTSAGVYCPYPQVTHFTLCLNHVSPDGSFVSWAGSTLVAAYDSLANQTKFGYNASSFLVAITDPTGKTDSVAYDASNHLQRIKDPGGRTDSITIDGSGNLSKIKDWAGGVPFFQGTYDSNHRLLHWMDRRGGNWSVAYDFAGKLAADTAPQVTANGQNVRPIVGYASAEQKMLIDPATGKGTSSSPGSNVDTASVRATFTNARGFATTTALDRYGAGTLIQEPLGRTTSFTRDSNSAVIRTVSPSGHVVGLTWNGADLTQRLDSTTGRTINYAYAQNHRVSLVSGHVDSIVNAWTDVAAFPYFWMRLDSTHTGGAGWTKFSHGSDGRICNIVDPGGHTANCFFTSTSGFQNTDSVRTTLGTIGYRYDSHGQRVVVIDQVHDTTQTVYDSIGRVVKRIGPLHDTTTVFYDDGLYETRVQDAKGQVYKIWPNALGWIDSTTDPAGVLDRYGYDLNGNRTSWTNRNGRTITYTYDALDKPTSIVADGKTTTFFYDPAGRYQVASDSESVDTLQFDSADRPLVAISCRLVSGNSTHCFRDSTAYETTSSPYGPRDLDTLTSLSGSSIWGGTTRFLIRRHYDVHMLLDSLTPGHLDSQAGQPITFGYGAEALDSIRTLTGLNNLTMTHSYPWTHRTDQVQLSDPSLTAALGNAYSFDSAGRMATRYHGSLTNPDTTRTLSYGRQGALVWYADSSHQSITSCSFVGCGYYCTSSTQAHLVGSTRYTYDSVGNRTDTLAASDGIDYTGNRQRRWQSFRMDYDAAGNMTAKRTLSTTDTTKVLRRDSLFWSALGRLDSVRTRDSTGTLTGRVGFGYDGWGRRIRKSTVNGTNRYLWDGDALLAQLDTLGNGVAGYTYYPELDNVASVLRHDRVDSTYYGVQDYSRNVLALLAHTNAGTTIDNQYRYDPFGNVQGSVSTAIPNTIQFAGREYDAETQLYYDRARYLDPALGRFVSEDPIGLSGGINFYAFVGNDPVNGWDPSGTRCKDWSLHQELFRDKAAHVAFGVGVVWLTQQEDWPRWTAIAGGAWLGLVHEGPWGKRNAKFPQDILHGALGDHDLTNAPGAPCAGFFDMFFFMLPGIWYTLHLPPYNFAAFPGQTQVPGDLSTPLFTWGADPMSPPRISLPNGSLVGWPMFPGWGPIF